MRGTRTILLLLALGLSPGVSLLHADLKAALAEHDLGRRSKLALDNAGAALKAAREAYQQGDSKALAVSAKEIQESVDLAWDSLESTGKNPRKNPRMVQAGRNRDTEPAEETGNAAARYGV